MSLTVANSRKSIKISSKFPGIKINKYSKKEKMEKEENPKNTSKGDKKNHVSNPQVGNTDKR